jgi:hypothetical protein
MFALDLGPVPSEEECQQFGTVSYDALRAWKECQAFQHQLERQFKKELTEANPKAPAPKIIRIAVHKEPEGYYEVVVKVEDGASDDVIALAYTIEENLPQHWDKEAKDELKRIE